MPKVKIDYSNTIFYKIYCKDPSIKELYIGHTTNFVQRKHAHKQGCINTKCANYNCKVYKIIRDNMGWENWTMEIIAFHKCEDLYSSKKQEQHYFEEYKATLNSIEPLPPRKPKKEIIIKPEKEVLYCNWCRVYFNTRTLQEEHNKRPRHLKMKQNEPTNNTIFSCEDTMKMIKNQKHSIQHYCKSCHFNCCNKKDFNRHLSTMKHHPQYSYSCELCDYISIKRSDYIKHCNTIKHRVRNTTPSARDTTTPQHANSSTSYTCECGKSYNHRASLWNHKKKCVNEEPIKESHSTTVSTTIDSATMIRLLQQNNEFSQLMIEQSKQIQEQNKQIIDLAKNSSIKTNNTTNNNLE